MRSGDDDTRQNLALWSGLIIGAASALLPTGYFDVQGAGLAGGATYAWYGVTVASPILLTALLCAAIGSDHERGLCRDVYLSGGRWKSLHLGAILHGLRTWAWFAAAAIVAGALAGLGDGWRHSAAINTGLFSLDRVAMCLVLQCYVAAVAAFGAMATRRSLAPLLVLVAALAAGVIATPFARSGGWDDWLRLFPYSPLIAQLHDGLLGRLSLPTDPQTSTAVMVSWVTCGFVCLTLRQKLTPAPK